jgi:hypothetical protein
MKRHYLKHLIIILCQFLAVSAWAQERTIYGKVSDNTGAPVAGVNVLKKGTTIGTITDIEGKYAISVKNGETLVFSIVGYKTLEIQVGSQSSIDVIIEEDVAKLEEVVVTGYATQEKKSLTGSVSSVSSKTINNKTVKTWTRSNQAANQVKLSVGDNETLPLKGAQMAIQIDGYRARILIDYLFFNDKNRTLEGNFQFRLPNGASPYYFAFGNTIYLNQDRKLSAANLPYINYENGQKIQIQPSEIKETRANYWANAKEARVVPKTKAALAYTETVLQAVDPALAEWAGADIFNCRVFPLNANQLHRIVIGYDVNLMETPLERILQISLPNKQPLQVDLKIAKIKGNNPELNVIENQNEDADYHYYHWQNPKSEELIIRYQNTNPLLLRPISAENNNYFGANFRADLPKTNDKINKTNAVLLMDISLSSNPDKFNIWLKTAEALLENNRDVIENFTVLFFNIESFWWKNELVANTSANCRKFLNFANNLTIEGATDLGLALEKASKINNLPKTLFLLSDASITWGEKDAYTISKKLNPNDRIFAFKTGLEETDNQLLEHLTRESGGAVFTISGEDEIAEVSQAFRGEAWEILDIQLDNTQDLLIQGRPRFIYPNQKLYLSGRGNPLINKPLQIKLKQGNLIKTLEVFFEQALSSNLTKRIYGQIATEQLESLTYLTESISQKYAMYFDVPGQTCSFLMLERESDYNRYNFSKVDEEAIQQRQVKPLIDSILNKSQQFLGKPKLAFLHWLENLPTELVNLRMNLDSTTKTMIKKLPESSFLVNLKSINTKQYFQSKYSNLYIEHLKSLNINYDTIFKEIQIYVNKKDPEIALKILSNLIEKNPGDLDLQRDIAFSAMEWGLRDQIYSLWQNILKSRPYEPQAYLALAQIYTATQNYELAFAYYETAMAIDWGGRYGDFNTIVAYDYINFIEKSLNQAFLKTNESYFKQKLESLKEEYEYQPADIVVILTWNTDNTDIDLHIIEPTGEECSYQHTKTQIGGMITKDATDGFGPEMYVLEKAPSGEYKIFAVYYSENNNRTSSRSKIYAQVYRNFGRANQTIEQKTVWLKKSRIQDNKGNDEDKKQDILKLKIK